MKLLEMDREKAEDFWAMSFCLRFPISGDIPNIENI